MIQLIHPQHIKEHFFHIFTETCLDGRLIYRADSGGLCVHIIDAWCSHTCSKLMDDISQMLNLQCEDGDHIIITVLSLRFTFIPDRNFKNVLVHLYQSITFFLFSVCVAQRSLQTSIFFNTTLCCVTTNRSLINHHIWRYVELSRKQGRGKL